MTTTHVFESTVRAASQWIDDVRVETAEDDPKRAYQVLRAILHVLRDRMTPEEVARLGAELPLLVRGIYYEGWKPAGKPLPFRDARSFLDAARKELPARSAGEPRRAVQCVLKVLERHVSQGEIEDVKTMLPIRTRDLWPD
jgi:uncharacterized protein (DUF2267 family)